MIFWGNEMNRGIRTAWAVVFVTILVAALAVPVFASDYKKLEPGNHKKTIEVDGRYRKYLIHVPPQAKPGDKLPMVLAFHGAGGSGKFMQTLSELNKSADKNGFIVVYPSGTGVFKKLLTWNSGNCCAYAKRRKVDDIKFVRAMLEEMKKFLEYDDKRVYATGISNGGMMTYRVGCELSDKIAAIAPVAGTIGIDSCNPSRPLPVAHFHGTADNTVMWDGGVGPNSITKVSFKSVDYTMDTMRKVNGCNDTSVQETMPNRDGDKTSVTKQTWSDCKAGTEVILYKIEKGGHNWPGGPTSEKHARFGAVTQDVKASDAIWEFFKKYSLK